MILTGFAMRLWDAFMVGAVIAGTVLLATSEMSFGGDKMVVTLPDVSGLGRADADAMAQQLAQVSVISSNCPDYPISDGEWTLLTGTGDLLAGTLGMDPSSYDREYFGPAFSLLDDPTACDRIGPQARPLLQKLVDMGGGTTPTTD